MPIQFLAQTVEVRIEGDKARRSLKESPAARVMRHAIRRTLAVAGRQEAVAGQTHRWRIERIDCRVAPVRFANRAIDVESVTCGRHIKAARSIEPIGNQQHGVVVLPT